MVKLVITDMDGTLVNSHDELPEDIFTRIEQLKDRGVRFAIASGRQYYNLVKRFQAIKDDLIVIAENGAMIFDHDECIYTDEINYEDVSELVHLFRQNSDTYVVLCGTKSAYIESKDEVFCQRLRQYYERLEQVDDLLEAVKTDVICKVAVYNPSSAEQVIYPIVEPLSNRFMLALSGNFWLDIMKRGIDKGTGIRKIQERYGLKSDECMAFGDYLNDYEMMQMCDYSYAMANAHPKLKDICNYETESNDDNGVVNELVRFFHLPIQ